MLAWIHVDVYAGSHFGWMSICCISKCLFYCHFWYKYLCTTQFINGMTRLVFLTIEIINLGITNFSFLKMTPPRFLYIISWSIITGLS